ncbi:MAG: DUF362 domain-containing protein [Deltaproteobacteria bacterium]|jgi:uncharacterized protein (DUF362 family)|nr:DUF362 domain-containing protein [Deltaproteobacteria bacterium]
MTGQNTDSIVFTALFTSWQETVTSLLDAADLSERLEKETQVLIKPNLVEPQQPPITTPVELIGALVNYIHASHPDQKIIIGEGSGSNTKSTWQIFEILGYNPLAANKNVSLIDLNEAPLVHLVNSKCRRWPEMRLPEIVFESFLISVPVLKAHSLAGITLTMKNMMGLAPPAHYQQGGHWKKASFHHKIQEAVFDLNRYRAPDFTLLDATIGMQEAHLWGPTCDPPPNRLAAGYDPVAVDSYGCDLLGIKWESVGHLALAHKILGRAAPLTIREI